MLWLLELALLEGRLLDELLPLGRLLTVGRLLDEMVPLGRALVLALLEGRLLTVGRLLVVGLLTLPLALGRAVLLLPLTEGRTADVPLLLFTLALEVVLPDMLPLAPPGRPSCRLLA